LVRIYNKDVKNWQIATAGTGGIGIAVLLLYLSSMGYITIDGFSGDSFCQGTEADPCYAYVNITAKTNVSFYIKDFNPTGNASLFFYEPGVKSWKLQYKSGTTWKDYSTTSIVNWKKGTKYQLRVVALKNKPTDTIKWSAFDGRVDPIWYGPNGTNYTTYDECYDATMQGTYQQNMTRNITTNGSPESYLEDYVVYMPYNYTVEVCDEVGINFDGIVHPYVQAEKQCLRTGDTLCCWLYTDGGTNVAARSGAYRTSIDSGERGICVDLSNNLAILSKQGDVSIP
jgi:hypothetical protein